MATERSNWQRIQPDTPLSDLTAADLMEAIGWAIASRSRDEGGKPVMQPDGGEVAVPGWKEVGVWGNWRSNWWGLPAK